MNEQKAQKGY